VEKLRNSERVKIKDNIITFKYYNSKDEIIENSCGLEKVTSFYIKKLEAISISEYAHQKDMKKTAKQILKIFGDLFPEYFI